MALQVLECAVVGHCDVVRDRPDFCIPLCAESRTRVRLPAHGRSGGRVDEQKSTALPTLSESGAARIDLFLRGHTKAASGSVRLLISRGPKALCSDPVRAMT